MFSEPGWQDSTNCRALLWTYISTRGVFHHEADYVTIMIIYSHMLTGLLSTWMIKFLEEDLLFWEISFDTLFTFTKANKGETLSSWMFRQWDENSCYDWMAGLWYSAITMANSHRLTIFWQKSEKRLALCRNIIWHQRIKMIIKLTRIDTINLIS